MMNAVKTLKNDLYETDRIGRVLLPLVLLFPVLSLSVRHWLSGIFSLMVLLALVTVWPREKRLYKEEKILLVIFALFILSFIVSATINGWTDSSVRRLGTEFKYLLFFPLYLLIRQYSLTAKWLILGVPLGAIILGIQALYDTFFTSYHRGNGIYGPIIFGDLSILFVMLSAVTLRYLPKISRYDYLFYGAAIFFGLLATYLSGSRNAWLAGVILLLVLPFLVFKAIDFRRIFIIYILMFGMVASIIAFIPSKAYERTDKAIKEYSEYVNGKVGKQELIHSSVGFRLEQWRVSLLLFGERPVFGFGAGNSGRGINRYVKAGLAHPDLYNEHAYKGITGVHSAYFEVLITEGLVGAVIFLLMLLYPIYVFLQNRGSNKVLSSMGLILMTGYMIFGTSENPFVHDNFTSVYLVLLAVIFSQFISSNYRRKDSVRALTL